jgi:hypothetical protein
MIPFYPQLARDCDRQPRSLRVVKRIFELGENRLNRVNALSQSLWLPLFGVEAAKNG